jgi:hypothetical protein
MLKSANTYQLQHNKMKAIIGEVVRSFNALYCPCSSDKSYPASGPPHFMQPGPFSFLSIRSLLPSIRI